MQDLSINVRAVQVEPFMFEPMQQSQEYDNAIESSSSVPESEIEDTNIGRIEKTLWYVSAYLKNLFANFF